MGVTEEFGRYASTKRKATPEMVYKGRLPIELDVSSDEQTARTLFCTGSPGTDDTGGLSGSLISHSRTV